MQGEPLSTLEKIQIVDNGELLIELKKICPAILVDMEESRMKREKGLYARKTVARMLKKHMTSFLST